MARQQTMIAVCYLYLLLSGHHAAEARRVVSQPAGGSFAQQTSNSEVTAESGAQLTLMSDLEQEEARWCNPTSKMRTKYYKMEVLESGDNCTVGVCTAYEFVRDVEKPMLKVHHGQSWVVKFADSDESDDLDWSLAKLNPTATSHDESLNILDAEYIKFGEENEDLGLREYILFKWRDGSETKIQGGMFYQGGLIRRGIEKLDDIGEDGARELLDAGSKGVRTDGVVKHHSKRGRNVAAGVGALTVAGFFAAATAQGIVISNTALITGALAAVIGGAVIGTVVGAGIGIVAGVAGVIGLVKLLRNEGLTGAEKIWQKLQCMDFETCTTRKKEDKQRVTTIVVSGKQCPK